MDALNKDVLNIIAGFCTRTAQAERAQKELAKDLTETRQTLKHAISELEEATRLANVLYKLVSEWVP
ncbi:hypothetical protein N7486_011153 [Penicillium sp. IBT 16267x]|nr:hypothetical protein N7486_011153 [Penicillium sp. IBT 16267x]